MWTRTIFIPKTEKKISHLHMAQKVAVAKKICCKFSGFELQHMRPISVARSSALYYIKWENVSSVTSVDFNQLFYSLIETFRENHYQDHNLTVKISIYSTEVWGRGRGSRLGNYKTSEAHPTTDCTALLRGGIPHHWPYSTATKRFPLWISVNKTHHSLMKISPTFRAVKIIQFICHLWMQLA